MLSNMNTPGALTVDQYTGTEACTTCVQLSTSMLIKVMAWPVPTLLNIPVLSCPETIIVLEELQIQIRWLILYLPLGTYHHLQLSWYFLHQMHILELHCNMLLTSNRFIIKLQ